MSVPESITQILILVGVFAAWFNSWRNRRVTKSIKEEVTPPNNRWNFSSATAGEVLEEIDTKLNNVITAFLEHTQDEKRHLGEGD